MSDEWRGNWEKPGRIGVLMSERNGCCCRLVGVRHSGMPTVLRVAGYRFFFYSNERHEAPHIHVKQSYRRAKIWLSPARASKSYGFRPAEVRRLLEIVDENEASIRSAWNEHFRDQN